jgi:hypothetical protein
MRRSSHSARLREKLDLLAAPARAASRALWAHPAFAELFPEYLVTMHCATRASVPLMEIACTRSAELGRADPVAAGLARYLTAHIPEERNHDLWLLEDLEVLGLARDHVLARVPPPTVAALVGSQYYWVCHYHPVALLGYIAVLEGYPLLAEDLERAIVRTALPRAAFRTLFEHSDLDQEHRDECYRALDALPLTAQQSALIAVSGFWTLHLLSQLLEEIVDSADLDRTSHRVHAQRRAAVPTSPTLRRVRGDAARAAARLTASRPS